MFRLWAQRVKRACCAVYVPGRGSVIVRPMPTDDPRALARTVIVPGIGEVYAVPVEPQDDRSGRQRRIDRQIANAGGNPTALSRKIIDLKCSLR